MLPILQTLRSQTNRSFTLSYFCLKLRIGQRGIASMECEHWIYMFD